MNKTGWIDIAELIGIAAIVASLVFVGLELKQNRDIAVATARATTIEGFRELNFVRLNSDAYWQITAKLNDILQDPGPLLLGIPVSTPQKWRRALAELSHEEFGRFNAYHLQEKNEAERMYELSQLGLSAGGDNGRFLISIRAPLWHALREVQPTSEFNRLVLEELKKYQD